MTEQVVLVDEQNNEIGTAEKDTVHTSHTPLHRGFSVFLFNSKNELLITQRALTKKTFPGIWTNTVCGHPAPGEAAVDAAKRRLKDELGILGSDLYSPAGEPQGLTLIQDYRYRFADKNGIVEHEICPILVAYSDQEVSPDLDEIADWKWIPWSEFLVEIERKGEYYSPWCCEEARILEKKL